MPIRPASRRSRHDHYGWPEAPRCAFRPVADAELIEVPVTIARVRRAGSHRPAAASSGCCPAAVTDRAVRAGQRGEGSPAVFYFHPWEIDPGQPRVANAPLKSKLRHYSRLGAMAGKLRDADRAGTTGAGWTRSSAREAARLAVNAPLLSRPLALRAADLGDAIERARIDAFVHAHPEGTPFHLPAWSVAVAQGCGQTSHYLVAERGQWRASSACCR